jgi:hypothetical protein
MPTRSHDEGFAETMKDSVDEVKMSNGALDNAIDWISRNLNPDDIFGDKELSAWAKQNGFVKE